MCTCFQLVPILSDVFSTCGSHRWVGMFGCWLVLACARGRAVKSVVFGVHVKYIFVHFGFNFDVCIFCERVGVGGGGGGLFQTREYVDIKFYYAPDFFQCEVWVSLGMPVRKKTVDGWNFSPNVLGYECNLDGDVIKIFCKVCREAYSNSKAGTSANFNEAQKDVFVIGTEIVKKT